MQFDDTTLSVIVPVYNVERFLEDCINSILAQTVSSMEILLIDDGSTDSSGTICDRFAAQDPRIRVIHQENSGVSCARNIGIQNSCGRYIVFADSDDVLPCDAYETLLASHWEGSLTMGQVQRMSENGVTEPPDTFSNIKITQKEFLSDLFSEKKYPYLGYPVDKLYVRDIIETHHIRFDHKIRLNEDRLFVLQYMLHCSGVHFINRVVYQYRQRSSGVIAETRRNATVTDSEMTVLDSFAEMQKICRQYSEDLYRICSRKAFESALDLLNRVSKSDHEKLKRLNRFLWANLHICLGNPSYSLWEKAKLLGHAVLKR